MPDVRGRASKPYGELKPYTPSWRDQLVAKLGGLFGDTRGSHATARSLLGSSDPGGTDPNLGIGLLDAVPGLGTALGAQEAYQQGGGVQGAAIAAIPIPGARAGMRPVQRLMRKIPKAGVEAIGKRDAENAIISATRSNQPVLSQAASGAAPDRSGYTLVRHRAKQGDSARFASLEKRLDTNPDAKAEIMQLAKDGEDIGRNWYNTEALRDRFVGELGQKDGDAAWREYMWMVGATSTGAKVPANIRMASHYFVNNKQQGLAKMAEDLLQGGYVPPKGSGYGHKMQKNQAKNVGNVITGGWSPDAPATLNPKPRGFLQSLLGNETNIAADKHFMRLMGMMSDDPQFLHTSAEVSQDLVKKLRGEFGDKFTDKYVKVAPLEGGNVRINFNAKRAAKENKDVYGFIKGESSVWDDMPNDNEYAAFERVTNKMAKELNMTGPQFQASLWMGAAKKTKVDPASLDTFVNLFDRRVKDAAAERGRTPADVFSRFARRVEPLAVPGLLGGGAAAGGLLSQPQQQPGMLQSPGL